MFTTKQECSALGATVVGLDLSKPLSPEQVVELEKALVKHQVLFFHDQTITPELHSALGRHFGALSHHPAYPTLEGHPDIMILDNDRENPSKIDEWHVDMSFTPFPVLGSILVARIIPERGGDTLFASLAAAYDDLPDSMKTTLEGLTATHSLEHGFHQSLAEPGGRKRLSGVLKHNPDVTHPLVRTHPVSGRKLIFYSHTFTRKINELSTRDSDDLMAWLHRHTVQNKYVCRFQWRQKSIAFWDNRSVIHKPINDYWPERRRMERVTIADRDPPS